MSENKGHLRGRGLVGKILHICFFNRGEGRVKGCLGNRQSVFHKGASTDFVEGVVLKCSTNNIKKLKCSDYRPTAAAPSEANSISQKHLTVAQQVAGQPPFENIQEILQHFTLRSHVQEKKVISYSIYQSI